MKRYMRIEEVATLFGVHERTVRRWWDSGKTCLKAWHPTHRITRGLLFTVDSVEAFQIQGEINPAKWGDEAQDMGKKKRTATK